MTKKTAGATKRGISKTGWSAKLTRSLPLKDGSKLITLADARTVLIKHSDAVIQDAALGRAILLLLEAAASGRFSDRKAATDQIAIVLARRKRP